MVLLYEKQLLLESLCLNLWLKLGDTVSSITCGVCGCHFQQTGAWLALPLTWLWSQQQQDGMGHCQSVEWCGHCPQNLEKSEPLGPQWSSSNSAPPPRHHFPVSWETYMQVKKQQLEPDMEQLICSKSGKECTKAVYCHPDYLTYMQNTSHKMPGWMNHKLKSRLSREILICRQ